MNTKHRAVRTGLAALAIAGSLAAFTGPAAADIPLETPVASTPTDIAGLATGSGGKVDGTEGGGGTGSASGSVTGSQAPFNSLSSMPVGGNPLAYTVLKALGYVPCAQIDGPSSTIIGSMAAMLIMLTSGISYDVGCAS
ncbi:hypothetical protein [Nocardia sp. NPDC005825]|uniref:hypothetical protein n=1 Tax=unclassified Nocardia TaxID=2637762 RepID=UPI0033D85FC2